jgi:hypothetical protein
MICCAGHVAYIEKMTEAEMFIGKPEAKMSRRKPSHRWEDCIKNIHVRIAAKFLTLTGTKVFCCVV